MTVDILPADRGDCLWIECHRQDRRPWRLLVDGGMPTTWPALRKRVADLAPSDRHFDLAIVSHIDSDHIGGMLPLLSSSDLGVTYGDVWFNGLPQLPEREGERPRSVAEGENLVRLLSSGTSTQPPPWNNAFEGFAVATTGDATFREVPYRDGPILTLLSPTPKRLMTLRKIWTAELDRLQRGEPSEPPIEAAPPARLDDLRKLAATETGRDASATNGSSIAVLVEYAGRSCLLAADAFPTVLGAALTSLANSRDGRPVQIDVFKLPHHGSKGNVTSKLLALVPARHYVVSSNGDRFHHPDDVALARVATVGAWKRTLWFNYETDVNRRWGDERLTRNYPFEAEYPAPDTSGVRIELEGRTP
jgi:hypothetical protein